MLNFARRCATTSYKIITLAYSKTFSLNQGKSRKILLRSLEPYLALMLPTFSSSCGQTKKCV